MARVSTEAAAFFCSESGGWQLDRRLREFVGVLLLDVPRYAVNLARRGRWVRIGNRIDHLELSPDGTAVRCLDNWASALHACGVLPVLGRWLFRRALLEWPIRFAQARRGPSSPPDLSFVIPHRGAERLPVLLKVLETIFAQEGVNVECLVVEQDQERHIDSLPPGVRYLHVPHAGDPAAWHKCLAFNVGVREAAAEIVVCHDGDLLVPCRYGAELLRLFRSGATVAFPQRFLFYLGEAQTQGLTAGQPLPSALTPELVRQNWRGGTLAIRRTEYARIGGFDERFVGWTGEDIEFHDRCLSLPGWFHGYIPFVHLWHAPQPTKAGPAREANLAYFRDVMHEPRESRIARLLQATAPGTAAKSSSP